MRRRAASSRIAPLAALPIRVATVARHDVNVIGRSFRWLVTSREHTNFTYDLTDRNLEHLAWWVALIGGCSVAEARRYVREPLEDQGLHEHVSRLTAMSSRRGLADRQVRFGRRIGWYALVRARKPDLVVETGTDKGLGSCLLASALLRNGAGRLTTIDVNPDSGYLIGGVYGDVVDWVIGDSVSELSQLAPVDLFLHDSLHTYAHETAEYAAAPLAEGSLVLSDNAHATNALAQWAEGTGRRFLFFGERPRDHWYPGSGIGAAWH